jgi:hypothetical protein
LFLIDIDVDDIESVDAVDFESSSYDGRLTEQDLDVNTGNYVTIPAICLASCEASTNKAVCNAVVQ